VSQPERYTEAEAQRFFAIQFNGKTWDLLDKPDRTREEDELMIHSAHASCRHWLEVGTGLHHQRGEWLIARVYSVLGLADAALRHASRCLELTETYSDLMADFDQAYAYEGLARANAVAGKREEALKYVALAEEAGENIAGEQDRKIFMDDFNSGNWGGVR
jgi:tetratricopeptide (TPR) repeat protein